MGLRNPLLLYYAQALLQPTNCLSGVHSVDVPKKHFKDLRVHQLKAAYWTLKSLPKTEPSGKEKH